MAYTVRLQVEDLKAEDTWKDIVRIHKTHRKDHKGGHIDRGTICCISVGKKSKWVVVHGRQHNEPFVRMDLNTRLGLEVDSGTPYDFTLKKLPWVKRLWFPWRASDPIYRYPAQLGLLALIIGTVLGFLGIVLGLLPILKDLGYIHY